MKFDIEKIRVEAKKSPILKVTWTMAEVDVLVKRIKMDSTKITFTGYSYFEVAKMLDWLTETYGKGTYEFSFGALTIPDEEARVSFMLRWS